MLVVILMTYARKSLVSLQDTPYYHCVARCVRRAWLWGRDEYAGKDYSHRKAWVIERLQLLCAVFAMEVCAYAVMSNHYHLVLFVDAVRAGKLTEEEVIERWECLYKIPPLVRRYRAGEGTESERDVARKIIACWRARLMDVSWFMRSLNEYLARRANQEDGCTGRFWEGRFRSQALLDEAGLLTAMAYVDLNPIRAMIATTPEDSEFTSIYERIKAMKFKVKSSVLLKGFQDESSDVPLPFKLHDYLELVDKTGRVIRPSKRGAINDSLPSILTRLNINPLAWEEAMKSQGNVFGRAMGRLNHLHLHAKTLGQAWIKGLRAAERMYRTA